MRDPRESAKAIDKFAWRVLRRLSAAGDRSISLEDVKQELWIAWCIACDTYKAESGVPFLAYLNRGMRLHINRHVEKNVDRRHDEVTALSLDRDNMEDGEAGTLADIIPAADPTPDEAIEHQSQVAYVLRQLSPRTQMFVSLLERQPDELLEQVQHIDRRTEYAKSLGIDSFFSNRVTAAMVFDVMGADRLERQRIYREIRLVSAKVQRSV